MFLWLITCAALVVLSLLLGAVVGKHGWWGAMTLLVPPVSRFAMRQMQLGDFQLVPGDILARAGAQINAEQGYIIIPYSFEGKPHEVVLGYDGNVAAEDENDEYFIGARKLAHQPGVRFSFPAGSSARADLFYRRNLITGARLYYTSSGATNGVANSTVDPAWRLNSDLASTANKSSLDALTGPSITATAVPVRSRLPLQ